MTAPLHSPGYGLSFLCVDCGERHAGDGWYNCGSVFTGKAPGKVCDACESARNRLLNAALNKLVAAGVPLVFNTPETLAHALEVLARG